jgi:hypothetical protein
MPHVETPWIGLVALVAMFVIPFLPNRLFEGPGTVKHKPRRHVCALCNAPWNDEHICTREPSVATDPTLRGELRRLDPPRLALDGSRRRRAR